MNISLTATQNRMFISLSFSALLAGCGGGGGGGPAQEVPSVLLSAAAQAPVAAAPADPTLGLVTVPSPLPAASTADEEAQIAAAAAAAAAAQSTVPGSAAPAPVPAGATSTTGSTATAPTNPVAAAGSDNKQTPAATTPPTPAATTPPTPAAPATGPIVTDVRFENTGSGKQTKVPVSFGQVFADGDVAASEQLTGKLADGSLVPLQMDVKTRYASKAVRHAVLSAVLPALQTGQTLAMGIAKATTAPAASALTPAKLAAAGFSAKVSLKIDGQQYAAAAEDLLKAGSGASWLSGAVANEWLLVAPLKNASGAIHPHLVARFAVRAYAGLDKAKVDVVIENNWAYEAGPRNFTYDADIQVGGASVYTKAGLNHYHHARWKKTFWWGGAPQVHVKHNIAYLIASKQVPNYDQSAAPSSTALAQVRTAFAGAVTEPMQRGMAVAYMPQTGGRPDIGLLPGWAVTYLLSMDKDAKAATLGAADLAGSWSAHFRDKKTDRVVSLVDYPYMTVLGRQGDTLNPVTKKYESFPACGGTCETPLTADSAHEPNFAYLPYLVTGDNYYLEELQFWAMFNMFQANPGYRDNVKGLLKADQVRGQAWGLRTLAEAAAITPDADPLKAQFDTFLSNNLDWYNSTYSNSSKSANTLGAITDDNAMVYNSGTGLAPWQDDFFTMAVGRADELGFAKARPLLRWKANFPVGRMVGAGYCWIDASVYKMIVRDSATSAIYTDFARAYKASQLPSVTATECASAAMAAALNLRVGEMVGYADVIDGYPAYLQAALAYSVNSGHADAKRAWTLFQARPVKPDYSRGAQFALLPR